MQYLIKVICIVAIFVFTPNLYANAPKVGRSAAAKYFQKNPEEQPTQYRYTASEDGAGMGRLLGLGLSTFTKSESFNWVGNIKENDVAKWGLDLSYRLSQQNSLVDYGLRISYLEFEPSNNRTNKLSFTYSASFPDAESRFPLYFGAAGGVGIFMTQAPDESPITFDYQLFAGARLFEIFEKTGFYVEGGLKNHLQLTSSGQLNGTFLAAGLMFTF